MWVPAAELCQAKSGQTRVAFKEKPANDGATCVCVRAHAYLLLGKSREYICNVHKWWKFVFVLLLDT